jgi:ADP-ribose pyrophosphatase YjhB (NUDIX family)
MTLKLHHRVMQQLFLGYSRVARGMTLGVRAMLIHEGEVVLVRHSYVPGWYLPGGGVEPGESLGEALAREAREEAGAVLTAAPQLFGIYRNAKAHRRDHVALYICRNWERHETPPVPNREITACERFPVTALPHDTSPGTLARITEVFSGMPPAADW